MDRNTRAKQFRTLHQPGSPIVLYNVWDAGGATAIAGKGAKAIATGSWAIAAAHGYEDGESIPLEFALKIIERIAAVTDLPLTVDFEGGYATSAREITANIMQVIQAGAIGVNFEDQIIGQKTLYPIDVQSSRIAAVREAGEAENLDLFINARTDLFLQETDATKHGDLIEQALMRADAYGAAGADCFFVPGLTSDTLIRQITDNAGLPVNVMMMGGLDDLGQVASLGVSRASFGPGPYIDFVASFANRFSLASRQI